MPDIAGLHPAVREGVYKALADPRAKKLGLYVVSAFRSISYQASLYAGAVENCRVHPSKCPPNKWVAPPGHSNHGPEVDIHGRHINPQDDRLGFGIAVDWGVSGTSATVSGQWPNSIVRAVDLILNPLGFYSPMDWEDWHYEPSNTFVWTPTEPAPQPPPVQEEDDMLVVGPVNVKAGEQGFINLLPERKGLLKIASDTHPRSGPPADPKGGCLVRVAIGTDKAGKPFYQTSPSPIWIGAHDIEIPVGKTSESIHPALAAGEFVNLEASPLYNGCCATVFYE